MLSGEPSRAVAAPALACGFAAGALLDVIVLHEILQWHHLFSARHAAGTLRGLQWNLRWDGVFELVSLALLGGAVASLVAARPDAPARRAAAWLALAGWGLFNVVDEFVFHLVLGAHHIRGDSRGSPADWTFFGAGALLFALGVYGASRSRVQPSRARV
jgi:uncharacterized membrane protein